MFDVLEALRELVEKEGSDLHVKVDSRPLYRVNGVLAADESAKVLSSEDTESALKEILHDERKLEELWADARKLDWQV